MNPSKSASGLWTIEMGDDPIVAAAVHDGHALRDEVAAAMALPDGDRLREEDPFTGSWTAIASTRIIAHRSRFEVDLNRPRERAIYRKPEDAWGLNVWRGALPDAIAERSLADYDAFYAEAHRVLSSLVERFGAVVVLDLHTYNHRRGGPDGPEAARAGNPEVNIGTGTLDHARWGALNKRFISDLRSHDFLGRQLDVRENVKFQGGHFAHWIHETFAGSVCDLAIEFKKFFMDEWTGEPHPDSLDEIARALRATLPGIRLELGRLPAASR